MGSLRVTASSFSGIFSTSEYNGLTPDYYVAVNGSNSNDGLTTSTPWHLSALNGQPATGQRASGIADSGKPIAGKIVGVMDGTYNFVDLFGAYNTGNVARGDLSIDGGSSGNPTYIVSQTRNGAIFDWDRANQTSSGAMVQPYGSYVTLDGIHFTRGNHFSVVDYYDGGNFFTVKNCLFTDHQYQDGGSNNPACIFIQGNDDTTITNCRMEQCGDPSSDRFSHIVCYDTKRTVAEYCTFLGTTSGTGPAFELKNSGPANEDCTFRYNYCECNRTGSGYRDAFIFVWDLPTTKYIHVHNNIFVRTGASGGVIWQESTASSLDGIILIYNNTFVGPAAGGLTSIWRGNPSLSFYNNILSNTVTYNTSGHFDLGTVASLGTWDYNWYDSSPTLRWRINNDTSQEDGLSNWQSASSLDSNSAEGTDPVFVSSGTEADQYKLDTGSACLTLGAGSTEIGAWAGQSQIGSTISPYY